MLSGASSSIIAMEDRDIISILVPGLVDPFGVHLGQSGGHVESLPLPVKSPGFDCETRSIFNQVICRYDRITTSAIILCYFDIALLEVDIHCDHPTRIEDFLLLLLFLFLFFDNVEPFP